jgi:threonylcarbamoyladenosine tRNA methylthiotransferase MtaB
LLEKLLSALSANVRLRLSSMEPDHIDGRLLEALKDPRMQPHFHIPVQSGSDRVLQLVDRHYTISELSAILEQLKHAKDDPFLAADIITGLPGESEEDFQETKQFILSQGFSMLHVFPFSPRPDTPLYHAKHRVPEKIRDERALELRELSKQLHDAYKERQLGKESEVILQNRKGGHWYGLSGNYLEVTVTDAPPFAREGMLVKGRFSDKLPKIGKMEFISYETAIRN